MRNKDRIAQRATFDVAQLAQLLGLSVSTIYEAVRKGDVAAIRFGRRVLIPRAELDRLLGDTLGARSTEAAVDEPEQKDGRTGGSHHRKTERL